MRQFLLRAFYGMKILLPAYAILYGVLGFKIMGWFIDLVLIAIGPTRLEKLAIKIR